MTTETLILTSTCAGVNHLTFTLSGAVSATIMLNVDDLTSPLTEEDVQTFAKLIGRMAKQGRTLAQARTLLLAGVTVTV